MKKIRMPILLGGCTIAFGLFGLFMCWSYYKHINFLDDSSVSAAEYDKHYMMITDDTSDLWCSVYESAREAGSKNGAYVEWVSRDGVADYGPEDWMRIAVAARVDGIMTNGNGSKGMSKLIEEASGQNIPVVIMMNDVQESGSISFVGVNSYQVGEIYGKQALECLKPGINQVLVLIDSSVDDIRSNIIFSQLNSVLEDGKKEDQKVQITPYEIDSTKEFNAEEAIRDILVNEDAMPDILICLDAVSTECAYQSLIDYNEVGNVDIIGYYASGTIMEAVEKGLIASTISISTKEIGYDSVEALNEYLTYGHVSNYYNVGLEVISKDNVKEFLHGEQETGHE